MGWSFCVAQTLEICRSLDAMVLGHFDELNERHQGSGLGPRRHRAEAVTRLSRYQCHAVAQSIEWSGRRDHGCWQCRCDDGESQMSGAC